MSKILFLHENQLHSKVIFESLEKCASEIAETTSTQAAVSILSGDVVDAVVIASETAGTALIDALVKIQQTPRLSHRPVIVISSDTQTNLSIEIMKSGAFEHLRLPLNLSDLEAAVKRALMMPRPRSLDQVQNADEFFVGSNSMMRQIERMIALAATCDQTVLVTGETGTGKDALSRSIYKHSRHKNEPLTVIDCTAVPEDYGSFRSLSGAGATVILDEIGDLNSQTQAMLVRALKEFSNVEHGCARIIASSQYDLINMVKERKFREDLYYRLNVISIHLPPLRERGADAIALAEIFLQQANSDYPKRLSNGAAKLLLDYSWPGNVRELQNVMYHLNIVVTSSTIEANDLALLKNLTNSAEPNTGLDYYSAVAALETRLLTRALKEARGSRAEAARLLGINRQLLYSKMKAHGLEEQT